MAASDWPMALGTSMTNATLGIKERSQVPVPAQSMKKQVPLLPSSMRYLQTINYVVGRTDTPNQEMEYKYLQSSPLSILAPILVAQPGISIIAKSPKSSYVGQLVQCTCTINVPFSLLRAGLTLHQAKCWQLPPR